MGAAVQLHKGNKNFYEVVKNKTLISYDAALLSIDTKEKMDRLRLH